MRFKAAADYLEKAFENHRFKERFQENKLHSYELLMHTCSNGSRIFISFPGYKSKVSDRLIVYDYRVNLEKGGVKTALSHVNIIVDLFNKCRFGGLSAKSLAKTLIHAFTEGDFLQGKAEAVLRDFNSVPPPSNELLLYAEKAGGEKVYNKAGNQSNLETEEFFHSLKWIVLQEDINYPMPHFWGRKMPLARYMEAIAAAENKQYKLAAVIRRALSHTVPQPLPGMDYGFLEKI